MNCFCIRWKLICFFLFYFLCHFECLFPPLFFCWIILLFKLLTSTFLIDRSIDWLIDWCSLLWLSGVTAGRQPDTPPPTTRWISLQSEQQQRVLLQSRAHAATPSEPQQQRQPSGPVFPPPTTALLTTLLTPLWFAHFKTVTALYSFTSCLLRVANVIILIFRAWILFPSFFLFTLQNADPFIRHSIGLFLQFWPLEF